MTFSQEELKLLRLCIVEAIYSISQWNFGDDYDTDLTPYNELRDKIDSLIENWWKVDRAVYGGSLENYWG